MPRVLALAIASGASGHRGPYTGDETPTSLGWAERLAIHRLAFETLTE